MSKARKQARITAHGVGGEGGALEDVEDGAGVKRGLLVDGGDERGLSLGGREEVTLDVKLETCGVESAPALFPGIGTGPTLGDLVLELHLGLEDVGRGPGLGESDAVLGVDILALDITVDGVGLGVAGSGDLERDVVGRLGLEEDGRKTGGRRRQ